MSQCSKCGQPAGAGKPSVVIAVRNGEPAAWMCSDCQGHKDDRISKYLDVAIGLARDWRQHVDRHDSVLATACVRALDLLVGFRDWTGRWTYPAAVLDAMGVDHERR